MRAIVNKDFFLGQALPIKKMERITISGYGGELSGTSIGSAETFRIPAHIIESGQVYLTQVEWRSLIVKAQNWQYGDMLVINL
jgi:hypothetical protein